MKSFSVIAAVFFMISSGALVSMPSSSFGYDSGSTGADGAFAPSANTEVALPENGVLNYTTVNIPSGVTVTFKKNALNTPVYMLATGDVTISGAITVNGTDASVMQPGKAGPGGFDGGRGTHVSTCGGAGLGPGGAQSGALASNGSFDCSTCGSGGGFGAAGTKGTTGSVSNWPTAGNAGNSYGNEQLIPIIGGSGGGSGCANKNYAAPAGGGGGGAILIASSGKITINSGTIAANGGKGASAMGGTVYWYYSGAGGGGSGGAIKLMADTITGSGTLQANAGEGGRGYDGCLTSSCWKVIGGNGGSGRIRLEATNMIYTVGTSPAFTSGQYPSSIFPSTAPGLKIASVGGVGVPEKPSGTFSSPDVLLTGTGSSVEIAVNAVNVPPGTVVTVTAIPDSGARTSASSTLSGTLSASSATVTMSLPVKYRSVLYATITVDVQSASNDWPVYAEGERVLKMRIASAMGGGSTVTYITESGREIEAVL